MTVENWALVVSIFGNLILLYQWRDSVRSSNEVLKKEIMQSALMAKETVYATQASLKFFLQEHGAKLEARRLQALERASEGMTEHCAGLLALHNSVAQTNRPKRSDLEELSARISVVASESKEMSSLVEEARKHHDRA